MPTSKAIGVISLSRHHLLFLQYPAERPCRDYHKRSGYLNHPVLCRLHGLRTSHWRSSLEQGRDEPADTVFDAKRLIGRNHRRRGHSGHEALLVQGD